MALKILEEKTFNQIELYTDITSDEIIQSFSMQQEGELEGNKEKFNRIDHNIHNISHSLAIALFLLFALFLLSAFVWVKFIDIRDWHSTKNIIINVIYLIILITSTGWGIFSWAGWLPTRKNIIIGIESVFEKIIKKIIIE